MDPSAVNPFGWSTGPSGEIEEVLVGEGTLGSCTSYVPLSERSVRRASLGGNEADVSWSDIEGLHSRDRSAGLLVAVDAVRGRRNSLQRFAQLPLQAGETPLNLQASGFNAFLECGCQPHRLEWWVPQRLRCGFTVALSVFSLLSISIGAFFGLYVYLDWCGGGRCSACKNEARWMLVEGLTMIGAGVLGGLVTALFIAAHCGGGEFDVDLSFGGDLIGRDFSDGDLVARVSSLSSTPSESPRKVSPSPQHREFSDSDLDSPNPFDKAYRTPQPSPLENSVLASSTSAPAGGHVQSPYVWADQLSRSSSARASREIAITPRTAAINAAALDNALSSAACASPFSCLQKAAGKVNCVAAIVFCGYTLAADIWWIYGVVMFWGVGDFESTDTCFHLHTLGFSWGVARALFSVAPSFFGVAFACKIACDKARGWATRPESGSAFI